MPLYVGVELGQEENFGAAAAVAVALGEEILFDRSGLMGYEAGLADGGGGEAAHGIEHGTGAKELVGTGVGLALDIAECKRAGVLQLVGGVVCEVAQDDVRELVCQRPAQAGDRRVYVVDEHDIPEYAIVDPDMMASMPKGLTAATGMDALTHAIEGYTTKAAWKMLGSRPFTARMQRRG